MKKKNPLIRLIQYYMLDMKLQSKFLIMHLILILVPTIIISVLFYGKLYNIIITNTIYTEQNYTEQTAGSVELMLSQITHRMDTVLNTDLIKDLFYAPNNKSINTAVDSNSINNFEQAIKGMTEDGLVSSIQIYYDEPYSQLLSDDEERSPYFQPMSKIYGAYWYGIFSTQEEQTLLCPSLYLAPSAVENHGDLAYICKLPYLDDSKSPAAFVAVYFSQANVDTVLRKSITITDSVTYIINERDSLVSTSDKMLSGKYFMTQENLRKAIGAPGKFVSLTTTGGPVYSVYYTIPNSSWYMVSILSSTNVMEKGSHFVYMFLLLYFSFLLLAFIFTSFLSRSIVRRISSVIHQMEKAWHGKPVRYEEKYLAEDEIGNLVNSYNYMTDQINFLMNQQEQTAKDLRLSEFHALQAQINPHFLYNTLDMINWLALSDKKTEVSKAVHTLSKFYKLTLRKKDMIGPIEQELEHISLYVQIQNMRYDDQIQLIIDVPLEITEYHIPKLTFQPIIENSISHGIFMKADKQGTIVVTGWIEGEDIVIQISDDGVGMEKDVVDSILEGTHNSKKGSNIGVYNTHLRLQLLFGSRYGLFYESSPGTGTVVEIRLPSIRKEKKLLG